MSLQSCPVNPGLWKPCRSRELCLVSRHRIKASIGSPLLYEKERLSLFSRIGIQLARGKPAISPQNWRSRSTVFSTGSRWYSGRRIAWKAMARLALSVRKERSRKTGPFYRLSSPYQWTPGALDGACAPGAAAGGVGGAGTPDFTLYASITALVMLVDSVAYSTGVCCCATSRTRV